MFYHGFENYMEHAFPDDEIRPISCVPLTRDNSDPRRSELNDPLGNYSLTLIDSLSTLAILASSPSEKALNYFQEGVELLVEEYGDGTKGQKGQGKRSRGFDLDSKVQVFETVIRGVGGLLSAHLFAIGELPITGYDPKIVKGRIVWPGGWVYNGQLLRLAYDLASRLLPAFSTTTGLPYPRVNLRHGVPFYLNSPLSGLDPEWCKDAEHEWCQELFREPKETCSAGAGSLVLEFTVLSRLTGDPRFEKLAKRAFWSIWERRSSLGLVGAGIDAESGLWTGPFTGLGASIDSFFEYAVKSYVLLSGSAPPPTSSNYGFAPPLTKEQHDPESFLEVWHASHAAIKRHLYRSDMYVHPHYIQADLYTGASRAFWMDSLSAFFPGLLTLTGDVEEAVETHLLFTALWNRYSALPERWSTATGSVEGGLGWWGGRPEFIESTYHIYRATRDPWYLHVGEMALRDIKRRCWARCGWSGLQDVRSGELNDRQESFFLGETTKYLYLLFDENHPLNKLDAPFVFTTEGHPLIIPSSKRTTGSSEATWYDHEPHVETCPVAPKPIPLTVSVTAARKDLFHAANLARLPFMPTPGSSESPIVEFSKDHPSISISDVRSPTNYTYYPWTLPLNLIPPDATCRKITPKPTFDITFPSLPSTILTPGLLQRVGNGVLVNSMGGLRLNMIQDVPMLRVGGHGDGDLYRVQAINHIPLGKDEKVFLAKDVMENVVNSMDPNFLQVRDPTMLEIVIDLPKDGPEPEPIHQDPETLSAQKKTATDTQQIIIDGSGSTDGASQMKIAFGQLLQQVSSMLQDPAPAPSPSPFPAKQISRHYIPAITPSGLGAAPLPDWPEAPSVDATGSSSPSSTSTPLFWTSIYITDTACDRPLPSSVPKNHQIIVLKRGGCSFGQKIANIPSFAPSRTSLQLVIIVSFNDEDGEGEGWLTRPLLDNVQVTSGGLPRRNPIPMVMVGGGEDVYEALGKAVGVGVKRRYTVQAQGVLISNLIIL